VLIPLFVQTCTGNTDQFSTNIVGSNQFRGKKLYPKMFCDLLPFTMQARWAGHWPIFYFKKSPYKQLNVQSHCAIL
jgi:hypothetical protein